MFPWLKDSWFKLKQIFMGVRAPHAVLLYGSDGLGKKEMARELGELFLCGSRTINGYCGVCQSCTLFHNDSHPDFHLVESIGNSRISIDTVREIIKIDALFPRISNGKVIVIENIENMTIEAANALLKVLEEPSGKTLFILTTDKITKLLPTILSRCIHFHIQNPVFSSVKSWIYQNLADKNSNVTEAIYCFNNMSPIDTVRFYNEGYYKKLQTLGQMFALCVKDLSCTEKLIDVLTDISIQKQKAIDEKVEKESGEKVKAKSYLLRVCDIYEYMYAILSDVLRYRLTQRYDHNLIIFSPELLGFFKHIPTLNIDIAINELVAMNRREAAMPNSYVGMEITSLINDMFFEKHQI